jgi:hypothetical protein
MCANPSPRPSGVVRRLGESTEPLTHPTLEYLSNTIWMRFCHRSCSSTQHSNTKHKKSSRPINLPRLCAARQENSSQTAVVTSTQVQCSGSKAVVTSTSFNAVADPTQGAAASPNASSSSVTKAQGEEIPAVAHVGALGSARVQGLDLHGHEIQQGGGYKVEPLLQTVHSTLAVDGDIGVRVTIWKRGKGGGMRRGRSSIGAQYRKQRWAVPSLISAHTHSLPTTHTPGPQTTTHFAPPED